MRKVFMGKWQSHEYWMMRYSHLDEHGTLVYDFREAAMFTIKDDYEPLPRTDDPDGGLDGRPDRDIDRA